MCRYCAGGGCNGASTVKFDNGGNNGVGQWGQKLAITVWWQCLK